MNDVRRAAHAVALATGLACACGGEIRDEVGSVDELWPWPETTTEVEEPIEYGERTAVGYGLPRAGQASLADVQAILADHDGDAGVAILEPGQPIPSNACGRNNAEGTSLEDPRLPITVEVVVTLHPRQYIKASACGQDERNYGSFVIEDDTAGIVVRRNSRVAPFTFGSRLRMTIRGLVTGFNGPTSGAVLSAEYVQLPSRRDDTLYRVTTEAFDSLLLGQTQRVRGWAIQAPTSANFNALVLADEAPATKPAALDSDCLFDCAVACASSCAVDGGNAICRAEICPQYCDAAAPTFSDEVAFPVCWAVSIDSELGRRGFEVPVGTEVQATGPVVDSFGSTLWVNRLGQIEVIE